MAAALRARSENPGADGERPGAPGLAAESLGESGAAGATPGLGLPELAARSEGPGSRLCAEVSGVPAPMPWAAGLAEVAGAAPHGWARRFEGRILHDPGRPRRKAAACTGLEERT